MRAEYLHLVATHFAGSLAIEVTVSLFVPQQISFFVLGALFRIP